MKDGLCRDARESGDALGDKVLHTLRDESLLKERNPVTLGVNKLVELLDLVTEFDRQCIGLELAGVADGFHGTWRLLQELEPKVRAPNR